MRRTYLLGAGASVEAGIPASRSMAQRVYQRLSTDLDVLAALNVALGGLQFRRAVTEGTPFDEVDVEDLFETLIRLSEREQHPLAPFVGAWSSAVLSVDRGDPASMTES